MDGARQRNALFARLIEGAAQRCRSVRGAPLRVIVIGEFNAVKTTLINTLLGEALLPTSIVGSTRFLTVVRFAARPRVSIEGFDGRREAIEVGQLCCLPAEMARRVHVGLPREVLKRAAFIDTPSLGANTGRERLTVACCSRADVVMWCTPAMQAWKASEQGLWLGLPERVRRKGILAITFADAIPSARDRARLIGRLHAEAGRLFRDVLMVSPAQAQPGWQA